MSDGGNQVYLQDIEAGLELPAISMPISLQRLVMEAGANRDFSLIHHDRDVARATGAPDAYVNTFFLLGMIERLLREWMGVRGAIRQIGALRMRHFNVVGDVVTLKGTVREIAIDNAVVIDVRSESDAETTMTAVARVTLPVRD